MYISKQFDNDSTNNKLHCKQVLSSKFNVITRGKKEVTACQNSDD